MNSYWIKTNVLDLATRRGKANTPQSVHLMLSPYDVPTAVRAYQDNRHLVIEFRYINIKENRLLYRGEDDGVNFEIGEKTQRIYKVLLDSERLANSAVNIFASPEPVEAAIDHLITHQDALDHSTSKYLANRSVFRDYADLLKSNLDMHRYAH